MIFVIRLLMDDFCEMPEKQLMEDSMSRHLGDTICFTHSGEAAGFAPLKYKMHSEKEDKDVPPQLLITKCTEITDPVMDGIAMSQLWDCENGNDILESCRYQVLATDILAAGLDYRDRADMLVAYIEALAEMFPSCKAFVFDNSKKMFTREDVLNCQIPEEDRFIHYAVNVRFFNIEGTEDMLVDTVGMDVLFMPDLQYHFHGFDPNEVVSHARNLLSYMFEKDNPIKSGDRLDNNWTVQYEESLIQPEREVIDINMGEFASGER